MSCGEVSFGKMKHNVHWFHSTVVPLLKDTLAKGHLSNEDVIKLLGGEGASLFEGDYCCYCQEFWALSWKVSSLKCPFKRWGSTVPVPVILIPSTAVRECSPMLSVHCPCAWRRSALFGCCCLSHTWYRHKAWNARTAGHPTPTEKCFPPRCTLWWEDRQSWAAEVNRLTWLISGKSSLNSFMFRSDLCEKAKYFTVLFLYTQFNKKKKQQCFPTNI